MAEVLTPPPSPPLRIAIWGPSAAGKTMLLARLATGHARGGTDWELFPSEGSLAFVDDMRAQIERNNRFPRPTQVTDGRRVVYRFRHRSSGQQALLEVEDRAGKESEDLAPEARDRLAQAQGIVLVFDPQREAATLREEIIRTVGHVYVASGVAETSRDGRDPRPIAICLTKADRLARTAAQLRRAMKEPAQFAQEWAEEHIHEAQVHLRQLLGNHAWFALSAAGVFVRHGAVEPAVFYDENLELRVCDGAASLNMMSPFTWILDQLA